MVLITFVVMIVLIIMTEMIIGIGILSGKVCFCMISMSNVVYFRCYGPCCTGVRSSERG